MVRVCVCVMCLCVRDVNEIDVCGNEGDVGVLASYICASVCLNEWFR